MIKKTIKFFLNKIIPKCITRQFRQINNLQDQLNGIRWEILKLRNLFLVKESHPDIFETMKVPLPNEKVFVDRVVKNLCFPEFTCLKQDFAEIARKFVIRFACSVSGLPLDMVRDYLLRLIQNQYLGEYAFYYLVEYMFPQHEDDSKAKVLEEAYACLKPGEHTDTWRLKDGVLRWICFLMFRGETEKAKKIFMDNKLLFTDEDIAAWLPVSSLAHETGMANEDICRSIKIFKRLTSQANAHDALKEFMRGKSIAIVGNGPYEKGTGHGQEIDSHDLVCRFNSFVISDDFLRDYGKKVNTIVNWGGAAINHHYYSADFFILPNSIYFCFLSKEIRDFIFENPKIKILNFDMSYRTYFQNKYNYHCPSTGLRMVCYFAECLDIIKKLDIYGICIDAVDQDEYFGSIDWTYGCNDIYLEHEIYKDLLKCCDK